MISRHHQTLFWMKVKKTNYCWEWTACRHKQGYGKFFIRKRKENINKEYKAHRLSYELVNGRIPNGMVVRHSCDNPPCVNPDHLSIGTQRQNMMDCIERGRHASVKSIKEICKCGLKKTVHKLHNGETYRRCKNCRSIYDFKRRNKTPSGYEAGGPVVPR